MDRIATQILHSNGVDLQRVPFAFYLISLSTQTQPAANIAIAEGVYELIIYMLKKSIYIIISLSIVELHSELLLAR